MKVIRIFGIVAAVHAFAFILIMANPGCSTKPKAKPTPASTEPAAAAPSITVPTASTSSNSPVSVAPLGNNAAQDMGAVAFDPNATAVASTPRYSPTRPGTPASTALQSEQVADVTSVSTITVGKGDSLWSIAKKYGIPVADLAEANHIKVSTTLHPGRKLVVPGKALGGESSHATSAAPTSSPSKSSHSSSSSADTPSKPSSSGSVKHVVRSGESLAVIAKKYGVRQADIAEANNLRNPAMIPVGKELTIPGASSSSRSSKAASSSAPVASESSPAPTYTPEAKPARAPVQIPQIGLPSPDQDLDAGLKPAATGGDVPVIKIDDGSNPSPKTP